ncbi:hypothetical protein MmTuc01_3143 [Methanosarcina mazei Tuc01]|uniref:Uncharacterized protein n=1 Tax=Methanosarcina mazei Tuc01 TaxID=1236903 RepID=M1Q7V1_METMZ|nr:hypothetical protein [Methanosarcina mazei]AGF98400.1 hypothetical protein MmTuc01_3143 [Methanosarcina mazei Tuc01]
MPETAWLKECLWGSHFDPVAIEEVRSFVEDIYLLRLDVEARLQGLNSLYTAQLTEELPVDTSG